MIDEVQVVHSGNDQTYRFNVRRPERDGNGETTPLKSGDEKKELAITEDRVKDKETQVDRYVVLEGCIYHYITQLYWRDASPI